RGGIAHAHPGQPIPPEGRGGDLRPPGRAGRRLRRGRGREALAEDLELPVHPGAGVVVALPDGAVRVVGGGVGHRRVGGAVVGVAVGTHVGEAEVVDAHLRPRGRVQALTENLVFVVHQRGGVVVASPDDEVLVGGAVVSHRWTGG